MALIKKNPPDGRNFITVCAEDPDNPGDIYALAIDPATGELRVNAEFTGELTVALHGDNIDGDNVRLFSACDVGTMAFTGSGLDDMTVLGRYVGTASLIELVIEIDGNGTPDTFQVSIDGGSTFISTAVAITGLAQVVHEGLTIIFSATTGHTIGDKWEANITPGYMINPRVEDGHGSSSINPTYVALTGAAAGVVLVRTAATLALTAAFQAVTLGAVYDNVILKNDDPASTGTNITYTLNGGTDEHVLEPGDSISLDNITLPNIEIKGAGTGGQAYTLIAWG